jgi:hypothetical protein
MSDSASDHDQADAEILICIFSDEALEAAADTEGIMLTVFSCRVGVNC